MLIGIEGNTEKKGFYPCCILKVIFLEYVFLAAVLTFVHVVEMLCDSFEEIMR